MAVCWKNNVAPVVAALIFPLDMVAATVGSLFGIGSFLNQEFNYGFLSLGISILLALNLFVAFSLMHDKVKEQFIPLEQRRTCKYRANGKWNDIEFSNLKRNMLFMMYEGEEPVKSNYGVTFVAASDAYLNNEGIWQISIVA